MHRRPRRGRGGGRADAVATVVRLLAARWALSRIPALGRAPASYPNAAAVRRPLGVPDDRVGEGDETVTDGPGAEGANGLLVADLVEEAIASPEHDRVDRQPQLVDQAVLHHPAHEL